MTVVILTTAGTGTWTVPTDAPAGTPLTIETWGGGGGGFFGSAGRGGGGGAYATATYTVITGDVTSGISYHVGAGGAAGTSATAGGDTWWKTSTTILAKGGDAGNNTGSPQGGQASASIGTTTFDGGDVSSTPRSGGGGAAGPDGAGISTTSLTGGAGDAGLGGAGGGGGLNGGSSALGGGGGGGNATVPAGAGGAPGGGGGGADGTGTAAAGAAGQISITYTPATGGAGSFSTVSRNFFAVEITAFKPGATTITFAEGWGTSPWGALAELADAVQSTGTIYASNTGYRTASTDSNPTQPYPPLLDTAFQMDRQFNLDPAQSGAAAAWGSINLSNADGGFNSIAGSWNSDGRPIKILRGSQALETGGSSRFIWLDPAYSTLVSFFTGLAAPWFLTDTELQVPIRDATYWLERPLQTTLYGGTGTYDGNAALAGQPLPKARGGTVSNPIRNVTPLLIDPTNRIYQYTDGPGAVIAIYEGGAGGIAFQADTTNLYVGTTTAGEFRTDNSRGLFQLGSTPQHQITVDVIGSFPVAGAMTTLCSIAQFLLSEDLAVPSGNINTASFLAADTTYPYTAGVYFPSNSSPDGVTAISQLIGSIGAKLYPGRDGALRMLVLRSAVGNPVFGFTSDNTVSVKPRPLPATLDPPIYRARIGYNHNYTVQTSGLNPTLTAAQLQFLAAGDTFAAASSTTVLSSYLRPNDLAPLSTALLASTAAQSVANDTVVLWGTRRRLYDVVVPFAIGVLRDLGDLVSIKWPADNLVGGQIGQLVGEQFNSADSTITFQVLV